MAINSAILDRTLLAHQIGASQMRPLKDVSLADMMEAVVIVRRYNENPVDRTLYMTPGDSVIAATYTLEHWRSDPSNIVATDGNKVVIVEDFSWRVAREDDRAWRLKHERVKIRREPGVVQA